MPDSRYPPLFTTASTTNFKRTNNGPESFHTHFNEQFYSHYPNMFIYIDVIKKIQTTTYIKVRSMDTPAEVRKKRQIFFWRMYGLYLTSILVIL